jgi:hypothetical protein
MIVKRTTWPMKPRDHFCKVLSTLYPPPGRIDEERIIDTLVASHRRGWLVTIPILFETFGQYRSNIRFVLLSAGLRCAGRASSRLRIQRPHRSKKYPYSV